MRYKPAVFEDYGNQNFIQVLLQTPPGACDGVTLIKAQIEPIKEVTPGVSQIHYNFVMQIDGVSDLETTYDQHHAKTCSVRGGLTFIPRNVPMAFQSNDTVQNFSCLSSNELWSRIAAEYLKGDPAQISLAPRVNFRDPLTESILWTLLHELASGNVGGRLYVESLMQTLILHTLVHASSVPQLPKPTKATGLTAAQLRCVQDFIEANYQHEISLVELANSINFSPDYFLRQFKRSLGVTPHQYLIQARVEHARQLLKQNKLTVAEVAAQVGFYDQSHLAHHFKRSYGVAPKMYVEQEMGTIQKDDFFIRERENLQDSACSME